MILCLLLVGCSEADQRSYKAETMCLADGYPKTTVAWIGPREWRFFCLRKGPYGEDQVKEVKP